MARTLIACGGGGPWWWWLLPLLLLLHSRATSAWFLSSAEPPPLPQQRWQNLVLEGGGARGISYIGAFKALAKHGYYSDSGSSSDFATYEFERIAGTSIGCLFGLAVALDIPPSRLERLALPPENNGRCTAITLESLLGARADMLDRAVPRLRSHTLLAYARHAWRYAKYLLRLALYWRDDQSPGLANSRPIMRWLATRLLPQSPHYGAAAQSRGVNISLDTSLAELKRATRHELTCFATRLVHNSVARFSVAETPDATLRHVLYASMALPGVFKPACDKRLGCPLVDGGLLNNFPIYEYDDAATAPTLGLSLHGTLEAYRAKCSKRSDEHKLRYATGAAAFSRISTSGYVAALLDVLANVKSFAAYATDPRNAARVVYLDSQLKTLERNLDVDKIRAAIDSGYAKTDEFLQQQRRC